jgi:hypothetical protein
MGEIRNVKLELLRSGPAHNQLLSPLTPYLALCGADGPVTVHMPFEHAQLLTRLDRLRYALDGVVGNSQRQAEIRELGEALGRVFSQVPALLSEISNARSERNDLIHVRLSVAAYELALVPFELAIGADAYPGSGSPLLLQSIAPVALTREVRRGRPLPLAWNRQPKILFAFASPATFPAVPAQAHLEGLRRAVAPFVKWFESDADRIQEIQKHITVLPNASLPKIREACSAGEYTHVHILAHGELIKERDQYGIALCQDQDNSAADLVDGETLATALTVRNSMDTAASRPTVVTLATCDSGNVQSVVIAGGSIAHALHAGGIPWVVASQFPLWMKASSIATEVLYAGLLKGEDPRWVLHTVRQRLRSDSQATHDWASIVAYAVTPYDFAEQVQAFKNRQKRQLIEMLFHEAEKRSESATGTASPRLAAIYQNIRKELKEWRDAAAGLSAKEQAERLGISGASEKRIGIILQKQNENGLAAYSAACDFYKRAFEVDPLNHWVLTQYLSMLAVLNAAKESAQRVDLSRDYADWWKASRQIALWQLHGATGESRAWALGTLAELELLAVIYGPGVDPALVKSQIVRYCTEIVDIMGRDAFAAASTRRQFARYRDVWPSALWKEMAEAAIAALPEGESWSGRAYLGMHA